ADLADDLRPHVQSGARVLPGGKGQRRPGFITWRVIGHRASIATGQDPQTTAIGVVSAHPTWRICMVRRASVGVCLTAVLALAFGAVFPTAAPVRLARHPDYSNGRVVFSYLGDIWMANDDGSNVVRLTDNLAREVYPRFSPDGRSIAFSSNRYGNNDVFVMSAAGGAPQRLTYHT